MAELAVSIALASPMLVGEPRQGNHYGSYSYLPGSVLRGAVAGVLMAGWSREEQQKPHPEACDDPAGCSFCRVLYPENGRPPRFYDCYPTQEVEGSNYVMPFPHTAQTCKRFPGFKRPDDPEKHGIFDTLVAQTAARDAARLRQALPYVYTLSCPTCSSPLQSPDTAYYSRSDTGFYTARPVNRRFSRTAINRQRRTAQAGQLFTLTVMGDQMTIDLPEGKKKQQARTHLLGIVESGDADVAALKAALRQVRWLGSSSSRGLGQVERIRVSESSSSAGMALSAAQFQQQAASGGFEPAAATGLDLGNRLAAFNQAIVEERRFYQALGVGGVLSGRWYFTIDVLTDTFVSERGLPTLRLTAEMLDLAGAELDFIAVEAVQRGGWSNAWGLPRPRQPGIGAGSVFLFCVDSDDADVVERLFRRLDEVEKSGIGMEQERGAGRLLVCAPFHKERIPR